MINGTSNGAASKTQSPSIEIVEKPKRWRFSVEKKVRILRAADACAPGTVGAYLRREGIYSSSVLLQIADADAGLEPMAAFIDKADDAYWCVANASRKVCDGIKVIFGLRIEDLCSR